MSAEHTPWAVGPHPWPEQIGCCPLVGRPYSVHGTDMHNVAAAVSEDIARLIAAAPDLLDALQACLESLDRADTSAGVCCCGDDMAGHAEPMNCGHTPTDMGDYHASKDIQAARAAIAKATGEAKP